MRRPPHKWPAHGSQFGLVDELEAELNDARLKGAGDDAAAGWVGGGECAA